MGNADFGAFLWNVADGSFIELPGEGGVWPDAINNSSPVRVAGFFGNLPDGAPGGGVVWTVEDGALLSTEVLPPLTGSKGSWLALDINDTGDVAGRGDKNNAGHALLWTRDETTGAYVAVDLGLGSAEGIENVSLLQEGVIRVVGYVEAPQGKGKSRPTVLTAVMWTVRRN